MLLIVMVATVREVVYRKFDAKVAQDKLQAFSALQNTTEIIDNQRHFNSSVAVVDGNKVSLVMFGIAGHSVSCLESIPGWYVIGKYSIT